MKKLIYELNDYLNRPNKPGNWEEMAEKYNYSVVGLIAELDRAGKWKRDPQTGRTLGYKRVYNAERTLGQRDVGHFVNVAANMFSDLRRAV